MELTVEVVEIPYKDKVYKVSSSDFRINTEDIKGESARLAEEFCFWNMVSTYYRAKLVEAKSAFDAWLVNRIHEVVAAGGKYTTDTSKIQAVKVNMPQEYDEKEADSKKYDYLIKTIDCVVLESLKTKRDILINLFK